MRFLFEKKYIKYLTIYKTPIGPNQLDPFVFPVPIEGEQPTLIPSIHSQITRDLEIFVGGQPQRIQNYYLVGPACKPGSKSRNGELRVIIVLNKDLNDNIILFDGQSNMMYVNNDVLDYMKKYNFIYLWCSIHKYKHTTDFSSNQSTKKMRIEN